MFPKGRVGSARWVSMDRGRSTVLKEFQAFIMRGNILDLAAGIIIGTAFGRVVNSLVNDIIMPPIGLLLGGVDFSSLFINLSSTHYDSLAAAKAAGAPTINIGVFINEIITFLIVGFAVFLLIKYVNKAVAMMTKPQPGAPPAPPSDEVRLLTEIRDALVKR
jgi:large conductance mechanosensitive channel